MRHRDGSRVIEFACVACIRRAASAHVVALRSYVLIADNNQRATLVDEFYGPEYSLLKVVVVVDILSSLSVLMIVVANPMHSNRAIDTLTTRWRVRRAADANASSRALAFVFLCFVLNDPRPLHLVIATLPIGCNKF